MFIMYLLKLFGFILGNVFINRGSMCVGFLGNYLFFDIKLRVILII